MTYSRRDTLKSACLALGGYSGKRLGFDRDRDARSNLNSSSINIDDSRVKKLAQIAIDSAIAKGASYADVRMTYTRRFGIVNAIDRFPNMEEHIGIGVRALVGGYWGFASSPVWSDGEAKRLGEMAAGNGKVNVLSGDPPYAIGILGQDPGGSWLMPVEYDPFELPIGEIVDHLMGTSIYIKSLKNIVVPSVRVAGKFQAQDKYFVSSKNTYTYQRLYVSSGEVSFNVNGSAGGAGAYLDNLTPAGLGFELIKNNTLRDDILAAREEALEISSLPFMPVEVGRYETLFNRRVVAPIASQTIGTATELDRVLGYEANASGTSYITVPEEMLGSLQITKKNLSFVADRSSDGSVGKVMWDDEGIRPQSIPIIKDGVLVALQGSNDGYSLLKSESSTGAYRPSGGMVSETALEAPLVHTSDLHMNGDGGEGKLDDMRKGIKSGLEIRDARLLMDFQKATGYGISRSCFRIENGKRTARIQGSGFLFRSLQFWKDVTSFGTESEVRRFGFELEKGEPVQSTFHSVYATHLKLKELDVIDSTRKA